MIKKDFIIKRYNEEKIFNKSNSSIIFGRRKVGKTFFVKEQSNYDYYFFVTRSNSIFNQNNEELSFETFFELFKVISKTHIIAIDEFHRLPKNFLDYIHFNKPKKVILLTSTLWLATKMLEERDSPLVGIFNPIKFSIVSEIDIIKNLSRLNLSNIDLIENSVYLREPVLIEYYDKNIEHTIINFLFNQKYYLKNLVGEIFSEEGRQFSKIYEGILLAISSGKNISGEIASFLFSKKLIDKDSPSLIQKNLEVLVNLGLIDKIEVYNKKKFFYKIVSPLFDLYFYLISKYDYVEQDIPKEYVKEIVKVKFPYHVEDFFNSLFSKLRGLKSVKINKPEVDIALMKFKKLELIGEVKWRNEFKNKEDEIYKKLDNFDSKEKIIISKSNIASEIKQIELSEIIEECLKYKY